MQHGELPVIVCEYNRDQKMLTRVPLQVNFQQGRQGDCFSPMEIATQVRSYWGQKLSASAMRQQNIY
jgi:hypothetical protein